MFGHADFQAIAQRWDDFWAGKNTRPLYSITIPKEGVKAAPFPPYLMGFDGNYIEVADTLARWVESHEFYGEAIPTFTLSFGPNDFSAFCGVDLILSETGETSWAMPILTTIKDAKIEFDKNSERWECMQEFYCTLRKALGDSVFLAAPPLSAGLDAIADLYGSTNLLMDMVDEPEIVHYAVAQINNAYTEVLEACKELFEYEKYGSATRHGMYSSGTAGMPQCDISCMISPEMFDEFAVPCLLHEMKTLDAVEYHLDGPGALKHLQQLLTMEKLQVVQWVPGAGKAEAQDWTHLYKHILSRGKGLILRGNADFVMKMQRDLRSKAIFYIVDGIETRGQAEDFLADMEKICFEI